MSDSIPSSTMERCGVCGALTSRDDATGVQGCFECDANDTEAKLNQNERFRALSREQKDKLLRPWR